MYKVEPIRVQLEIHVTEAKLCQQPAHSSKLGQESVIPFCLFQSLQNIFRFLIVSCGYPFMVEAFERFRDLVFEFNLVRVLQSECRKKYGILDFLLIPRYPCVSKN